LDRDRQPRSRGGRARGSADGEGRRFPATARACTSRRCASRRSDERNAGPAEVRILRQPQWLRRIAERVQPSGWREADAVVSVALWRTEVMTTTLRRLDDGPRYYYLTWRQWLAALAAGGVLYAAVRFSPLSQKWTFTVVLLVLSLIAVAILPLTGNALGLDRYLTAIVRWTLGPKRYTSGPAAKPLAGGVLLTSVPVRPRLTSAPHPDECVPALAGHVGLADMDSI